VFGFSFGELMVISMVTLVVVGPQKLPTMLKTMGSWARKLRKMTMDVRQQTGIDEMLRAEGIQLSELRSLMRGYHGGAAAPAPAPARAYEDPYANIEPDVMREYPMEGADAYGALPDDLLEPAEPVEAPKAVEAPQPAEAKPAEPAPAPAPIAAPAPAPIAAPAPLTASAPAPIAAPAPAPIAAPASAPAAAPAPPPSRPPPPRPRGARPARRGPPSAARPRVPATPRPAT
jgi:sec-independent protein translocase protein TatB